MERMTIDFLSKTNANQETVKWSLAEITATCDLIGLIKIKILSLNKGETFKDLFQHTRAKRFIQSQ